MFRKLLLASVMVALSSGVCSAAERTIAGIVFQQDMFFRSIQLGMQQEAKAGGVTLLEANSDSKPEKEANLVDTFVARGVDAIIISPLSAKASVRALKKADEKGIKVILYNTPLDAGFPVTSIGSSDRDVGRNSGKMAADLIRTSQGGKARVAILAFKSQNPEQSGNRTGGFKEEVAKGGDVQVVAEQDAWLAEKAVAVASDIMTAHPEVNVIYAANEGGTVGAVQAVRKAGKQGKVFVFGTDGSEQLANFLLDPDGVLAGTTAQAPVEIGRMAVRAAIAALDGKPVDKDVRVPALPLSRDDKAKVDAFLEQAKALR
ncbi:MAG: sugar ABC transporter substrate-binding protein [Telmatospirillum sp.]|nr:sugar ABC transporter substrate-binding protein [Telmatospirillum sp.]